MAVDPATLNDPALLRNLADNARKRGQHELALQCSVRIAEIAGQAYDPGIEREFWQAVIVAEELKTAENGKTTRLSRTRQKVARAGVVKTVIDLAGATKTSEGFRILVGGGHWELTAEAIVLRHKHLFDPAVAEAAEKKLVEAGLGVAHGFDVAGDAE